MSNGETLQERLRDDAEYCTVDPRSDVQGLNETAVLEREAADKLDQLERELQQAKRERFTRDWPQDADHENGEYQCQCVSCGRIFIGHKRRIVCQVCSAARDELSAAESSLSAMRKALERLMHACEEGGRRGRPMDVIPRNEWQAARAALHAQQSAPVIHDAAAHEDMAWVPVEERLPEPGVEVLVCHVLGDRDRCPRGYDVAMRIRDPAKWVFPWDRRGNNPPPQWVTHWMPLPAPPHATAPGGGQDGKTAQEPNSQTAVVQSQQERSE